MVRLVRPLQALEALWLLHRQRSIPLQYLVGVCPWRDLELRVAPGVLIPRQESELLVDLALICLAALPPGPLRWADLGTGSGCLTVALAAALPPGSRGYAVDCSPEALAQVRLNLERAAGAASVELRLGQWWAPLEPLAGQLDLVVSNPRTSPRACWRSWSRWCASTNPTWRSMAVPMDWPRFDGSPPVPPRPSPPVAGCCWSTTTIRARPSRRSWRPLAWWR